MRTDAIQKAIELSSKLEHVFIATADSSGLPHMAAAGRLSRLSGSDLLVEAWFCPETVLNVKENKKTAIVVWDQVSDQGYQLLGTVEKIIDSAFLNGYEPEPAPSPPTPQIRRSLSVHVNTVLQFSHAPHSDIEE